MQKESIGNDEGSLIEEQMDEPLSQSGSRVKDTERVSDLKHQLGGSQEDGRSGTIIERSLGNITLNSTG